jgi:hypothetical protein
MADINDDYIEEISKTQGAPAPLPVPPHIASNLLEFLRRVESKGMEAVAWVEAYQFVQRYAPQPAPTAAAPK